MANSRPRSELRVVPSAVDADAEEPHPRSSLPDESGPLPPDPEPPSLRKLDAKRINECLKHFNAICNTLAAAIIGAAFLIPFINSPAAKLDDSAIQWCGIAFCFHAYPYVLNFLVMQSED